MEQNMGWVPGKTCQILRGKNMPLQPPMAIIVNMNPLFCMGNLKWPPKIKAVKLAKCLVTKPGFHNQLRSIRFAMTSYGGVQGHKRNKWVDFDHDLALEVVCALPSASNLTLKVLVATIDAQWEGMGDVGSVRYEPALLPPCPTIRVLSYSN